MSWYMDRRRALGGLAGAGLVAALGPGCSSKQAAAGSLPVRIVSSQGTQVVTINKLIEQKGYFNEFKLAPEALAVASGTNIIGPLLNGKADICIFAGFSQLLSAIEKGAELKILGGASIKGQQAIFSKNPAIRTVKDLEGHSVGTGAIGAQLHQAVTALLRKQGVDVSKVKFVVVGNSGDVFRSVVSGRVDAGNGQADVLSSLDRLGVHMVEGGEYAKELPEYTWQASFTSDAAINDKDRREALVRTLAAYCKAFRYVQSGPSQEDYVTAQLAALGPRDLAAGREGALSQWRYVQERKIYAEDLVLSPERVQYMQELNISLGMQKKVLPYERIIDRSLAEEAVARLS
jgi:ABC-type nitrate/sulfonate/bicarbonate transport system substrate-binding protein